MNHNKFFFYMLRICQSLFFLSFYIPLQILPFLHSCTIPSHHFCLVFCLFLFPTCFFHTNSPTCIPPKQFLSLSTYLHAFIHSQKSPYQVVFILYIRQTGQLSLCEKWTVMQQWVELPAIIFSTIHIKNKYQKNTIPLLIPKYFAATLGYFYTFSATQMTF